jgi:hypothetical protein
MRPPLSVASTLSSGEKASVVTAPHGALPAIAPVRCQNPRFAVSRVAGRHEARCSQNERQIPHVEQMAIQVRLGRKNGPDSDVVVLSVTLLNRGEILPARQEFQGGDLIGVSRPYLSGKTA